MDAPLKSYGAVGWVLVGLVLVVGSFGMDLSSLSGLLVLALGHASAIFGGFVLYDQLSD